MSQEKKKIRQNFRDVCFKRDKYCCVMCGFKSTPAKAIEELDCHHVSDRTLIVNGGYVKENGISLCPECHIKAEEFHNGRVPPPGFSPEELYLKIKSSLERAIAASERL